MQRVLVTGASRGLGRALVIELDKRGLEVTTSARRDANLADLPATERLTLDVTSDASVAAAAAAWGASSAAAAAHERRPHRRPRRVACFASYERRKETHMAGEVAFFEIGVEDPERGRAFYEGLFGWRFEPGPTEGGGFVIQAPNMPGGMHGGDPGGRPYVFFAVDDMDMAIERVRELGGGVEEMDVEGDADSQARFGRFKICHDDQGSYFGLHQPPRGS